MPSNRITKRRDFNRLELSARLRGINVPDDYTWIWPLEGMQITTSEGHPWPPKGDQGDVGGDFSTMKLYTTHVGDVDGVATGAYGYKWALTGKPLISFPGAPGTPWPTSPASSDAGLDKLGATAVARCAPGNPPANGAQFIGELIKDGIPSWLGSKLLSRQPGKKPGRQDVGDEYLNAQFGWAPIISDVKKFARSVIAADALISQYERDAGKRVRRRYGFPQEKTTSEYRRPDLDRMVGQNFSSWFASSGNGFVFQRHSTTINRWFSGSFTYYLPRDYDSRKELAKAAERANYLLGLELTPDLLWELTPWSWAIDWFSNTGDVLKNLRRFGSGGLIMPYGYMMEHTIVEDVFHSPTSGLIVPVRGGITQRFVRETKLRRKANPFGFGLTWNGLSAFQASIAGALGLSRS